MPFYWFLLVVTTLASDSIPSREVPALPALMASAGMMIGWATLVRLASRSASKQVAAGEIGYSSAASTFGVQMDLMRWLGLAISLLILVGFGLAGLLDQIPLVRDSIAMRALLLITPAMLATAWSWLCELNFDVRAQDDRLTRETLGGNLRHVASMFRMQAAWLVIPVFVLMLMVDVVGWVFTVDPAYSAVVSGCVALLALPFVLPIVLRRIWKLERISNPRQAAWCDSIVQGANVRGLRVMRWNTGGSFCTAMVAGFIPGFRLLLLSDALMLRLVPMQTSMVMLHELAHVRRFHLPIRLLALIPVWLIAGAISQLLADFINGDLVGVATGLGLSLFVLRWIAYRTEFDADATAVRLATTLPATLPGVPHTASEAADALSEALLAVTADQPSARKATWLHPSIDDRIGSLRNEFGSAKHDGPIDTPERSDGPTTVATAVTDVSWTISS